MQTLPFLHVYGKYLDLGAGSPGIILFWLISFILLIPVIHRWCDLTQQVPCFGHPGIQMQQIHIV